MPLSWWWFKQPLWSGFCSWAEKNLASDSSRQRSGAARLLQGLLWSWLCP